MQINKKFLFMLITMFITVNISTQTKVTGYWFYYTDSPNNGTSQIIINNTPTTEFSYIEETINGVKKQIAVLEGKVTTDFQYGYIGMGIDIDDETLNKLKNAKGIRFKVAGDKKTYRCRIETGDITDYDFYGYDFNTSNKITTVEIYFNKIRQGGWGKPMPFTPGKITQISFNTIGQPLKSVLLKVFDIEIIE